MPRVTLDGRARMLDSETPDWVVCRAAYVKRFLEAEFMTQLGDFRFVAIELKGARQVAALEKALKGKASLVQGTIDYDSLPPPCSTTFTWRCPMDKSGFSGHILDTWAG